MPTPDGPMYIIDFEVYQTLFGLESLADYFGRVVYDERRPDSQKPTAQWKRGILHSVTQLRLEGLPGADLLEGFEHPALRLFEMLQPAAQERITHHAIVVHLDNPEDVFSVPIAKLGFDVVCRETAEFLVHLLNRRSLTETYDHMRHVSPATLYTNLLVLYREAHPRTEGRT